MNQHFVLKYRSGHYVAKEEMSDGYPYQADIIAKAHFFPTIEAAKAYGNTCGWRDLFPQVYPVRYSIDNPIVIDIEWNGCDHHCIESPRAVAHDALHYLDCPIMVQRVHNSSLHHC